MGKKKVRPVAYQLLAVFQHAAPCDGTGQGLTVEVRLRPTSGPNFKIMQQMKTDALRGSALTSIVITMNGCSALGMHDRR